MTFVEGYVSDAWLHLVAAMVAGGMIGLERTYHGRAAGFRTHVLVCTTSALLMMVTLYQGRWFGGTTVGNVNTDPTRMAQGIMTGIGFLGAGVIMKDGLAVRGLTTAASIWITAALGILAGIGLYSVVVAGVAVTLLALSVFRMVENVFPTRYYATLEVAYDHDKPAPRESDLRNLLLAQGLGVGNIGVAVDHAVQEVVYCVSVFSKKQVEIQRLDTELRARGDVRRMRLSPAS